ncbi:MAG: hypothetical protein V4713_07815 [Pseudomonadota bacterium]
MSTTPKNLPRFLPTLTEVVHPSSLTRATVVAMPDIEDTVWFVMQRVNQVIEHRLREEADAMLRTVVAEQFKTLGINLRQELEIVVRQAVSEAMTSQINQH